MRHSILLPFITMTLFLGACLWVFAQADDEPIAQKVPARSPQPVSRILFGSCTKQNRPMPIFKTIAAQRPELFVFLGDNIYADTADMDVMRAKYAKLKNNSGFAKLMKTCPILATWDDHDYGVNDGGADYTKKVESQRIFVDF